MTYIVPEIALATRDDIVGILGLQEGNLLLSAASKRLH